MHNLYLGTAKHIVKDIWTRQSIISDKDFEVIQERVNSVVAPAGIPHKSTLDLHHSLLTSGKIGLITTHFSLLCTSDFLHGEDLECWRHFVLASRLLSY